MDGIAWAREAMRNGMEISVGNREGARQLNTVLRRKKYTWEK